jgi:SAM-dependent methyltransferase
VTAAPSLPPDTPDALSAIAAAVLGDGPLLTIELIDLMEYPPDGRVDVVRAGDDLLPRLAHQQALAPALARALRVLRPGGLLLAAVPELDRLRGLRPAGPPPRVSGTGADRRVTVQLWDWADDGASYGLDVVQLAPGTGGWEVVRAVSTHHQVLTPEQVQSALARAGFLAVQRLAPVETGHPLPVYVGVAAG